MKDALQQMQETVDSHQELLSTHSLGVYKISGLQMRWGLRSLKTDATRIDVHQVHIGIKGKSNISSTHLVLICVSQIFTKLN
jgi:hypothetical protein